MKITTKVVCVQRGGKKNNLGVLGLLVLLNIGSQALGGDFSKKRKEVYSSSYRGGQIGQ